MRLDLNDVAAFEAVAGCGSFTVAAAKLDLPASTVSRRVSRLEDRLGFRLLHRTTRSVGLTDAGRVFLHKISGLTRQVDEAARAAADARESPTGRLRITAPPDDGGIIWGLLTGFVATHPEIDLEITHTLEQLDLIEHGIDVALRGGPPPDSTVFAARKLFDSRILLAASPAYLAARGTPSRAEELAEHDGICMDPWAPNALRRVDGDRGFVRVQMRNRIRANRLDTARNAALDGLGIAPLLELTASADLRAGRLVEVLHGALPPSAPFWAVFPAGREKSTAAGALVEHVVEVAERWQSEAVPG